MSDTNDTTIRVIHFDGLSAAWGLWEQRFHARAERKNFASILTGTIRALLESEVINETVVGGPAKAATRKANSYAYGELLLLISTTTDGGLVAFFVVDGCTSTALPGGDARRAWE